MFKILNLYDNMVIERGEPMKYYETASRIKEAMNDIGISQQELADRSHIGKSSISHYVNGTNEPGNKSAYALARVLNVNPAWLMGLNAPKHNPLPDPGTMEIIDKIQLLPIEQRANVLQYIDFVLQGRKN